MRELLTRQGDVLLIALVCLTRHLQYSQQGLLECPSHSWPHHLALPHHRERRAPRPPDPARRWLTFLRNHREAIAAMDFFTVPTLTFGVLYCFFVIDHDRRRILHCNVTRHPSSEWVSQQLRETFPYDVASKYLILD